MKKGNYIGEIALKEFGDDGKLIGERLYKVFLEVNSGIIADSNIYIESIEFPKHSTHIINDVFTAKNLEDYIYFGNNYNNPNDVITDYRATVKTWVEFLLKHEHFNKWLKLDKEFLLKDNPTLHLVKGYLNPDAALPHIIKDKALLELHEYFNDDAAKNKIKAEGYFKSGQAKYKLLDVEEAIEDFTKAIELNPKYSEAYCLRGNCKFSSLDMYSANEDYNKAIEISPKYAVAYFYLGVTYEALEDYKASICDFTNAIIIDPYYTEAYCRRGRVKSRSKDYEGAIEDYTKAIELDPECVDAYEERMRLKIRLKYYKGAIEDYTKGIDPKELGCIDLEELKQILEYIITNYHTTASEKYTIPNVVSAIDKSSEYLVYKYKIFYKECNFKDALKIVKEANTFYNSDKAKLEVWGKIDLVLSRLEVLLLKPDYPQKRELDFISTLNDTINRMINYSRSENKLDSQIIKKILITPNILNYSWAQQAELCYLFTSLKQYNKLL